MLMQLYDTFIMPGAAQRRKLTSFVVGKAALEKGCFASLSPHNATLLVTRRCGYEGFSLYLDVHREASVCISTCLRVQASICISIGLGLLYDAYRCLYLCVYVCLDDGGHAHDGGHATLHLQPLAVHAGHETFGTCSQVLHVHATHRKRKEVKQRTDACGKPATDACQASD